MGIHVKISSTLTNTHSLLSLSPSVSMTLQFAKTLALKWQPSTLTEAGAWERPLFDTQHTLPQFMFPAY